MIYDKPISACDSQIECDYCGEVDGTSLFRGMFLCNRCREREIENAKIDVRRMQSWAKDHPGTRAWQEKDKAEKKLKELKHVH